jgi:hypothetical protein
VSGDLRAAVEAVLAEWASEGGRDFVLLDELLALIPEGAVLVTEETLARAFEHEYWTWIDAQRFAAAILRHLREGT